MSRVSLAARIARDRNWRIRNLRSLWACASWLGPVRRQQVRALIDAELADLGAEPEAVRRAA